MKGLDTVESLSVGAKGKNTIVGITKFSASVKILVKYFYYCRVYRILGFCKILEKYSYYCRIYQISGFFKNIVKISLLLLDLKFMFSKKAPKFDKIFSVDLTFTTYCQVKISSIFVAFLENTDFTKTRAFLYKSG